jgi:hypothetical protein
MWRLYNNRAPSCGKVVILRLGSLGSSGVSGDPP